MRINPSSAQLVAAGLDNEAMSSLVQKHRKNGKLNADELISLVNSILDEKFKSGKISAINDLVNNIPPLGWEKGRCMNCYGPLTGCFEDPTNPLRITITDKFLPITHRSCKAAQG